MALQTDNLLLQVGGIPRTLSSDDTINITGAFQVDGDATIGGNLVVQGTTFSVENERVIVEDNHILLNAGYTTAAAQTGGLVTNYLPLATATTVATGGFTAGVPATSNPTVTTVGSGTFAVGQLLLISDANNPANNGLYECLTHVSTTLTLRGVGTTACVEDFTDNQVTTDATVGGAITRVTVGVLRCGTDGAWEQANGATTGLSFLDLGSGSGNSLNQAYIVGNTITTDSGNGDVIIAGTEELQITSTGGLNVDTVADFDVTTFDVQMTSTNGFSIDGTAASNVSATTGNLTLSTITSGTLIIDAVAALTLDGTGVSIDGTSASNLSTTGANLTLSTITSGTLIVDAVALLDINAGANMDVDVTGTYDVLATGAGSLDFTGASNLSVASGNLTLATTTTGDLILSSAANATIDGTGVSIDGTSASNMSVTGAQLQISTITSGELDLTSAGLLDINAGANIDIDVTGTFDVLATTTFSIDGTGASNVTATSGTLTLSTVTSGGVNITSAGASTYTVANGQAASWLLTDGTDNYLRVDSVDNQLEILAPFVELPEGIGVGVVLTTDATLAQGDIVYVKATTGNVDLADANVGNMREANVIGVARTTATSTNPAQIFTTPGALIPVRFAAAPAAASNGRWVYLSQTAGQATLTAPTGASDVVYRLGFLQGGDGASTVPTVLWAPQFISRGASVTDT